MLSCDSQLNCVIDPGSFQRLQDPLVLGPQMISLFFVNFLFDALYLSKNKINTFFIVNFNMLANCCRSTSLAFSALLRN